MFMVLKVILNRSGGIRRHGGVVSYRSDPLPQAPQVWSWSSLEWVQVLIYKYFTRQTINSFFLRNTWIFCQRLREMHGEGSVESSECHPSQ